MLLPVFKLLVLSAKRKFYAKTSSPCSFVYVLRGAYWIAIPVYSSVFLVSALDLLLILLQVICSWLKILNH